MPDPVITNVDDFSPVHSEVVSQDDVITFGGADTFVAGTILARSIASGKLILYVKGGVADGNGVPKAIMTYDVTLTGAGDSNERVAVAGNFRKEKLVIDADGDDSNIDDVVKDLLSDQKMTAIEVGELNIPDNQ